MITDFNTVAYSTGHSTPGSQDGAGTSPTQCDTTSFVSRGCRAWITSLDLATGQSVADAHPARHKQPADCDYETTIQTGRWTARPLCLATVPVCFWQIDVCQRMNVQPGMPLSKWFVHSRLTEFRHRHTQRTNQVFPWLPERHSGSVKNLFWLLFSIAHTAY